ncbi:acyltransferase family protein [Terrarubrum flagellatum]|uniref:acyltransferase family protein n=1 Tax=Terrirubrum flagellatum TaxID=2895980 RepID=UPI0031453AAA
MEERIHPVRSLQAPPPAAGHARVGWVDVAKGLCIILVVMMHSTLGLEQAVGREGWMHAVVEFAQPFRIPAFFVTAGLFLQRTIDQPWSRYLDRKVVHFVYFYLIWALIQCVVKFAPGGGFDDALGEFLFALIEPYGTLWFIYLLPFFFVTTKLVRRAPFSVVFLGAVFLNLAPHNTGWTAIDEFMNRYVFFLVGYAFAPALFALADASRRAPDIAAPIVAAIFALIAAIVSSDHWTSGQALALPHAPLVALAMGAAGACALIATASMLEPAWIGRAIAACGRRSLAIYLAFFLPMAAMRAALVKSGLSPDLIDVGTASALITIAAATAPLLLHRLAMRGPFAWLFERPRWARGRSAKPARHLMPAE